MTESLGGFRDRLVGVEERLSSSLESFDSKLRSLEEQTLWKIKEFE